MTIARSLCVVGALVAIAATGCKGTSKSTPKANLPPPPPLASVDGGTSPPTSTGAPRALAAANRAIEQLAPDRRFVLAFEQVDRILEGASASHVVARRTPEGAWAIESKAKDGATYAIAQLPDKPDFVPLMDAVAAYASKHASPANAPTSPADALDIPIANQVFASLTVADEAWKNPAQRPLAARRATSALVGLLFGIHDKLEVTDELPARAIAAAAVARALGARPTPSVEALLARVLGYSAAAMRLAPATPNDAVAAYAANDDARLLKLARTSAFARNAWLRRLVLREDHAAARTWIDRELARERTTTPVMAAQTMVSQQIDTYAEIAARFPPIALAEAMDASSDLANESGPARARITPSLIVKGDSKDDALAALGTSRSKILLAYDAAVAALPRRDGTFRDAGLERDYLDANMIAAMTSVERYLVSALGSPTESTRQVNELAEPTAPRSKAFRSFFAATAAGSAAAKPDGPLAYVTAESVLGGRARFILLSALLWRTEEPAMTRVARAVYPRLDSRPLHRMIAGWVSKSMLSNQRATESFYRSAAEVAPGIETDAQVDVLGWDRDPAAILQFAKRTSIPPRHRASLVAWAMREKVGDPTTLHKAADDLMAEAPLSWPVRSHFVSIYLASDRKRARAIAQDWLDRKAGASNGGLGEVDARITLAKCLRREQKHAEAIRVLEPAAATWQAGAMEQLALAHARAGHTSDAEKYAQRALERYPQATHATGTLASVRWILGDLDGAAKAIATAPRRLTDKEVAWAIAPDFAEIWSEKPPEAARAAAALRAASLHRELNVIAEDLVNRQSHSAALAMLLNPPNAGIFTTPPPSAPAAHPIAQRVLIYRAMAATKGKDAAVAWLRADIGPDPRGYDLTTYHAYSRGVFDILDIEGPPGRRPMDVVATSTMRLAAQLRRDGKLTSADEARKSFAAAPNERYSTYGRYLLGDIDADTVEKLATSPKQTCELAYFMGVKAMGEAHHADAMDLLRVAVDTYSTYDAEYGYALNDLSSYFWVHRSIAALPPGLPLLPGRTLGAAPE